MINHGIYMFIMPSDVSVLQNIKRLNAHLSELGVHLHVNGCRG